jgi:hypothetical protein
MNRFKQKQSPYTLYRTDIEECKSEQQLLKVVENIMAGARQNNIDDYQMQRLEEIGMRKFEQLQRERERMIKNKKQGFNNFD